MKINEPNEIEKIKRIGNARYNDAVSGFGDYPKT